MIDWLNMKAALSIAVILLIGTAGVWYDHHNEQLTASELAALLDNFVSIIDNVWSSSTYITVNVTFGEPKSGNEGLNIMPKVDGRSYNIKLTQTHAKFQQGNHEATMQFMGKVCLSDNPREVLSDDRFLSSVVNGTSILKFTSSTNVVIKKIAVNKEENYSDIVMIVLDGQDIS